MKNRYILGKGWVILRDGGITLYKEWNEKVIFNLPYKDFWCYCEPKCKCPKWKLILEKVK